MKQGAQRGAHVAHFFQFTRYNPRNPSPLVVVVVVNALGRGRGEPGSVGAVVIDHVVGPDPNELVALV